MKEFKKLKLDELCINITDGEHASVNDDSNGDYYLLSNKNIIDGKIIISNFDRKISFQTFNHINKRTKLESGDLLVSTVGTLGKTAVMPKEFNYTFQRSVGIIKTDKKLLNEYYIKYLFDTPKYQKLFKVLSKGAIQKCIFIDDLKNLEIDIFDLNYQNKIVSFLKTIDDKIDINNRIVKKLESMMKDIYDYWFVQFDFPNEKGKPYKSSGGKMVYNEKLKREIPQNFKYADIGNIEKNIITGKTPPTINVENYNGEIPFITISDIRNNIFVYETEQTLSELGANTQNNKFLPIGSLCVSCIASIGEIGFTTKISQTNQQINSIIFENEYNKEFFYFALKDYFRKSYVAKTGNTFKNMNKHDFAQIKILYSEELVKCFHNAVKAYMDKVRVLYKQNSKLKHYKNFILPLLMNGQVEVK